MGPRAGLHRCGKSRPPPGFDPRAIQPVTRRYTYYPTWPTILFGIRRNCLRSGRSRSLYLFIRRMIKQTAVIIGAYHFCQVHTKLYPTSCCQGELHMQRKSLGTISVACDTTGQLLTICSALTLILRRSRAGTVWFYTSTSNKRAARPKLYKKSLTRDLKRMYSRLTLVRISINL